MRTLLKTALLLLLGALAASPVAAARADARPAPPNIVLIIADDLGCGNLRTVHPTENCPTILSRGGAGGAMGVRVRTACARRPDETGRRQQGMAG